MLRVIACAAVVLVATSANAHAQKVTTVPGQDTLVVVGVGKVRLAGIAALEPAFRMGSAARLRRRGRVRAARRRRSSAAA